MSRPAVGGPLYREKLMLIPAFQYSAFLIPLTWLFGLVFWRTIVGYTIIAIATVLTITAILLVPAPSAAYQKGAAFSVSLWDRFANGKRRWVLQGEVMNVCPVISVSPMGGKRTLVAYEIRFIGGKGRVYVAKGGSSLSLTSERRNQLTSAIRTMLGPKWSSVYRQIPSIDQDMIDRMNALLSGPAMRVFRRGQIWLLVMGFSVVAFSVMLVLFGLEMFGYVLCDAIIILLATLAIIGIYRYFADVRMAFKRFEAFSLYVQLKDYERTTGIRTIRDITVHQEYGSTEPLIMGETIM